MGTGNGATRHPTPRSVPTSIREVVPCPGTCVVCGCTDDTECPGGCEWLDAGCLFCSACARLMGVALMQALARAARANDPGELVERAPPPKKRQRSKGRRAA